jgi:hypothetical protein
LERESIFSTFSSNLVFDDGKNPVGFFCRRFRNLYFHAADFGLHAPAAPAFQICDDRRLSGLDGAACNDDHPNIATPSVYRILSKPPGFWLGADVFKRGCEFLYFLLEGRVLVGNIIGRAQQCELHAIVGQNVMVLPSRRFRSRLSHGFRKREALADKLPDPLVQTVNVRFGRPHRHFCPLSHRDHD